MQTTSHAIALARPKGLTAQRTTGLVFAGLLQLTLIWALIEGLNIKVWPEPTVSTKVEVIREKIKPAIPPPPVTTWQQPTEVAVDKPTFQIDDGSPSNGAITTIVGPAHGIDRAATPLAETHSTPPYPPLALRLAEQGFVTLHLTISPQGTVTEARVVASSGYDDLDQAARGWIVAHWRYRPALAGGAAVGSTSDVRVRFDLQKAQ